LPPFALSSKISLANTARRKLERESERGCVVRDVVHGEEGNKRKFISKRGIRGEGGLT